MKILKLTIVLLFFTAVNSFAQTADEIIDKHIAAIGGKAKISSIKSMRLSGKLNGQGMEFPFVQTIQTPSVKMEMTIQGMSMVQAYDGKSKTGWYIQPFQGDLSAKKMNEQEVKSMEDQGEIGGDLFDYKAKGSKVEYLGKDDMDGTEVQKLRLTKADGNSTVYFLDAASFYILREVTKFKFQDKEQEGKTEYSNYKTVDGYTMAYNINSDMGGEMTIEKLEINPVIDSAIFAMPAEVKK